MYGYNTTAELLATVLEQSLLDDNEQIVRLKINLSPDAPCAPDIIRYYFERLAANTAAAGAQLIFEMAPAPEAVWLLAVDITVLNEPTLDMDDF